jgi:hypothetical protein
MRRRTWVLVLAVFVLVLAGLAALFLAGRSRLDDAQREVDQAWAPLRGPLVARYLQLAAVDAEFRANGGAERAVARDLQPLLERWGRLQAEDGSDPEAEAETANALEGAARRLRAAVTDSARLRGIDTLTAAITAFDAAAVPDAAVGSYNRSVREYQDTREGVLWSPTADALGYDPRSVLVLPP